MDRRRGDRRRTHRLQLTSAPPAGGRALRVAGWCSLLALLAGCFDGRLDTFELAGAGAGSAGTEAAGAGGGAGVGAGGGSGQANATALMLDDFEDQDNNAGQDVWWYVIDDGSGPQAAMTFDAVTGRGLSSYAAHVAAGPTTGYGSFFGLDLPGVLFDASRFSALSFWARMEPEGELSVRFQSLQGTQFTQSRALDATWREFRLPMSGFLSTEGEPLDPTEIAHLQLWMAGSRPAFDLYVDDVWLLAEP
jgi:hypothetical protein